MLRSRTAATSAWWVLPLVVLVLALCPTAGFGQEANPCLNAEAGQKILALLPGAKAERDLSIKQNAALVFFKTEPQLRIRLEHPSAPTPSERFLSSANFRIVLLSADTPATGARFAQVAAAILKADQNQQFWATCRNPQIQAPRDPRLDQAGKFPQNAAQPLPELTPQARAQQFFLWLLAACGTFLIALFGLGIWQRKRLAALLDRLDKKRLASESAAARAPFSWLKCALAPLAVLVAMAWMVGNIGGSIEAVSASSYIYPYDFLTANTTSGDAKPASCEDGFFRQTTRPMFGICFGEERLALLQTAYISTLPYWPTTLLARAVPALAGWSMVWLSLIPAFLSLFAFTYLLCRRIDWKSANSGVLLLIGYPFLIYYLAVWFQDDAMAYKMLFLEWLFLDLWNQKGRTWLFVGAGFFLGMVGLSKLSVLPIGAGLFAAFVLAFGLRKANWRSWLWAALAGAVPLLLLLGSNYLCDEFGHLSEAIFELSQTAATQDGDKVLSFSEMTSHMGRFFFDLPNFGPETGAGLLSGILFCGLMLYCLLLVFGKNQRRDDRSGFIFSAWVVLFGTATYFYLYRYRAESYPGPCLLPFACVIVVAFFGDLLARIRHASRLARHFTLLALVLAWAFYCAHQWNESVTWYNSEAFWFKLKDQKHVTAQLLENDARRPLIYNSYLFGLFEFLSYGEIRPKYLPFAEGQALTAADWDGVLRKVKDAKADFLFPARCERHCASCRTNPNARELFRTALEKTGRKVRETVKIMDREGQPVLWLERL